MEESTEPLKFTGNWFIDAGILGFVNLMEEVYGWDLEELQRKLKEDQEKVYYGYFPVAYFEWLKRRKFPTDKPLSSKLELDIKTFDNPSELFNSVWKEYISVSFQDGWVEIKSNLLYKDEAYGKKDIKDEFNDKHYLELVIEREKILNKLVQDYKPELEAILRTRKVPKQINPSELEKILESENKIDEKLISDIKQKNSEIKLYLTELWKKEILVNKEINSTKSKFYRLPVDSGFYKNFLFFNYASGHIKQREQFYNLLTFNFEAERSLDRIDKMVNKLSLSEGEFTNISYTKISSNLYKAEFPYLFVYLLCFTSAFSSTKLESPKQILFYSSELEFTYKLNRRLRSSLANKQLKKGSIFRKIWNEVVDQMVEYQSQWSLENLYLVQYDKLDNRTQVNVDYRGISKLQATVLMEEVIRKNLNRTIKYGIPSKPKYCWLLKEFISGQSLYPKILEHVKLCLTNEETPFNLDYVLALDAQLKLLRATSPGMYSCDFFRDYKLVLSNILSDTRYISYAKNAFLDCFSEEGTRKTLAYELFSALKGKNRHIFMNITLKSLNSAEDKTKSRIVQKYIFDKILVEDACWDNYALPLIEGLMRK